MMLTLAALCVNATAQDFNFRVNGINYSINYDYMTLTVGENKDVQGILNIPETVTYNGKTYLVTMIGNFAFVDCSGLTQVNIPNSVTKIGL